MRLRNRVEDRSLPWQEVGGPGVQPRPERAQVTVAVNPDLPNKLAPLFTGEVSKDAALLTFRVDAFDHVSGAEDAGGLAMGLRTKLLRARLDIETSRFRYLHTRRLDALGRPLVLLQTPINLQFATRIVLAYLCV